MTPGVLFISYDGMLEPLGQSQVVAYLERLAPGRRIHLLSFEKPRDLGDAEALSNLTDRLKRSGIVWHPQRYHKKPPVISSVYDLAVGVVKCWSIVRTERLSIVHARNLLCACMGLLAAKLNGAKLLFDIRGFWADERIDGGMIRRGGPVYKVLKWLDKAMLRAADHIVTLTRASLPFLRDDPAFGHPLAAISVIPTCVDLDLFKPAERPAAGTGFVLGYVGQVGTWYRFDDMIALFVALRRRVPDAQLLVINQHQQPEVRRVLEHHGVPSDAYQLLAAGRDEVPALIQRMTFGMAVIKPLFSKISSCPTKLAEYLACGVPCIGNPGVGDVADLLLQERVGVVLPNDPGASFEQAVDNMLRLAADPELQQRCRSVAERHFSLEEGARSYAEIYAALDRRRPALPATEAAIKAPVERS